MQDVILEALTKAGVDGEDRSECKKFIFDSDIPHIKSLPEHKFYEEYGPFIKDEAKLKQFRENIMEFKYSMEFLEDKTVEQLAAMCVLSGYKRKDIDAIVKSGDSKKLYDLLLGGESSDQNGGGRKRKPKRKSRKSHKKKRKSKRKSRKSRKFKKTKKRRR